MVPPPDPSAWILTGLSGAGKATAMSVLEKAGVEVVDNLPAALVATWATLPRSRPAAAAVDARQGEAIGDLIPPAGVRVVYLDATEPALVKRLGESTRPHPCAAAGGTVAAIRRERELLSGLRAGADTVVDTTELTPAQLATRILDLVLPAVAAVAFRLTVSSFGFKFGSQPEADWIIDARFLRNPFWEPSLRQRTGLEEDVSRYVLADPRSLEFATRLTDVIAWTVAQYAGQGRGLLHVAVGCTGGRHRSVVMAEELGRRLRAEAVDVEVRHRDIDKPEAR